VEERIAAQLTFAGTWLAEESSLLYYEKGNFELFLIFLIILF
jgi:hypothetical protein